MVEVWVRESLVKVITCHNANEAFATIMALPNGKANPHVQIEGYIDKTLMTQYASGSHWDSLDHVNVNAGFCGVQKKRLWGMIRNAKHV